jgi:hypothetical protein
MTELDEWLNIIRCVAGNNKSEGMSVHSLSSSFQIGYFVCKYVQNMYFPEQGSQS